MRNRGRGVRHLLIEARAAAEVELRERLQKVILAWRELLTLGVLER